VRRPVARRDHVHRLARPLERDARLEPRNRLEKVAAALQLRLREIGHLAGPRNPDLLVIEQKRRCRVGQHAGDRVGRAVERERLAEHRHIPVEALPPHLPADQHHARTAAAIFIR
jgi:hypothetical protein